MDIVVKQLGKQFQEEWIFKGLDFRFQSNKIYAITGPNGSGKSTLLQVLSGFMPPTSGEINFESNGKQVSPENFYQYISVATPYTSLIEEFTGQEQVKFHFQFKKLRQGKQLTTLLRDIHLPATTNKLLKNFSSGMKQRLKLGLAFYSDTPIILLDEPTSNLDEQGIAWYQKLVTEERSNRLIVICSNQSYEYEQSDEQLDVVAYKPIVAKPGL